MDPLLLEMRNITKVFPGVKALDDVHLSVKKGEVCAIIGENGAGKSTLIKILGGIYTADEGEIYIDGEKINISDVNMASKAGISVVHQELSLCPNMTVAQNIFLGNEKVNKLGSLCKDKEMNAYARRILNEYELDLEPDEKLSSLTIAQQQMVELAKALSTDARIIVMDEPTDTLTEREIVQLFKSIKNLKNRGVSIIYISHRIEELFQIADSVTVLRDGRYIGSKPVGEIEYDELITMLVGRKMDEMFAKHDNEIGEEILAVKHLTNSKVKDCSFSLHKGEILGFYGLVGSGRTELMHSVFGIDRFESGEMLIGGEPVKIRSAKDAIDKGVYLIPEDRKMNGLVLKQTVGFNITIGILKELIKGVRNNKKKENEIIDDYIKKLTIKTPSKEQLVMNLSGGNQQKVVLSKGLATKPDIIIMDEPTRGIDVGAKKEIYEIMSQLAAEGVGIIMISSELPEVINMSNRILVMFQGKIVGELEGEEMTQEKIIIKATGGMGTNE